MKKFFLVLALLPTLSLASFNGQWLGTGHSEFRFKEWYPSRLAHEEVSFSIMQTPTQLTINTCGGQSTPRNASRQLECQSLEYQISGNQLLSHGIIAGSISEKKVEINFLSEDWTTTTTLTLLNKDSFQYEYFAESKTSSQETILVFQRASQ